MTDETFKQEILEGPQGKICLVTLNSERTLNALNLTMIDGLSECVRKFSSSREVRCIVIQGAGERSFCAGGDIKDIYQEMANDRFDAADDFFRREYTTDYRLHMSSIPIVCLASGIVMGGGAGVMQSAAFRVVTEKTIFAMPEIQIGLYPDVASTYFLNRMPQKIGLFLGLSGVRINASDLMNLGLADRSVVVADLPMIIEALRDAPWERDTRKDRKVIFKVLKNFSAKPNSLPEPTLPSILDDINLAMDCADSAEAYRNLINLRSDNDTLALAKKNVEYGSPLSFCLTYRTLNEFKILSLKEVFIREFALSCHCNRFGEFREGIRALIIDKDRQPKWTFSSVDLVPAETVDLFFNDIDLGIEFMN